MMIHATRLEELAGAPNPEDSPPPDENVPPTIVAAAAAAAAAVNNLSSSKISGMGTLATVTGALLKFKSKLQHMETPREDDSLTKEEKEARRLNLLRKKFRLTKEQVEAMSK
jgi:threonine synthase